MDSHRSLALLTSLVFLVFLYSSCSNKKAEVKRGFYSWKTAGPEENEREFLKQRRIQKLYAKLMDVDWAEVYGPVPVAESRLESINYHAKVYDSLQLEIVPVVFITNKTFERIDTFNIPQLAKRVIRRCLLAYDQTDVAYEERNYFQHYGGAIRPKEIQFDCDWTVKTAPKYFMFLEEIKKLLPADSIIVSATIRLHQYKYISQTGVPPVHRGMLMMYNISDPKKYDTTNSIFDLKKARAYFTVNKKYPLPLDIALPAWQWCIVFRNQKFYQVENGLSEDDLTQLSFLEPKGSHFYRVKQDTVYRDLYLRRGDEIKAEGIDEALLKEAAKLAQRAINSDETTLSFFELTYKDLKQYRHETFDTLYTSFR